MSTTGNFLIGLVASIIFTGSSARAMMLSTFECATHDPAVSVTVENKIARAFHANVVLKEEKKTTKFTGMLDVDESALYSTYVYDLVDEGGVSAEMTIKSQTFTDRAGNERKAITGKLIYLGLETKLYCHEKPKKD